MVCGQNLEWLKKKVQGVRSFGGLILGYVGLPIEAEGYDVLKLGSKTNFVTFRSYMNANRVYENLLKRSFMVKNLGNLTVIGQC